MKDLLGKSTDLVLPIYWVNKFWRCFEKFSGFRALCACCDLVVGCFASGLSMLLQLVFISEYSFIESRCVCSFVFHLILLLKGIEGVDHAWPIKKPLPLAGVDERLLTLGWSRSGINPDQAFPVQAQLDGRFLFRSRQQQRVRGLHARGGQQGRRRRAQTALHSSTGGGSQSSPSWAR